MEYISVSEAAKKWSVTPRQVQQLLAGDRIPGARKFERSWMIPADAEKPVDPRREKKQPTENPLSSDLAGVIKTTVGPWPSDNPDAILDTVSEKRLRLQY